MNMKQSCKALICAIEGELDGRHCTEEQAEAILDHALPSLTEALARVEAERDTALQQVLDVVERSSDDIVYLKNQLAGAVGLIRRSLGYEKLGKLNDDMEAFLARHAQAEQQEAQSPMAKIAEGLRQKAAGEWANHPSNPANQEARNAEVARESLRPENQRIEPVEPLSVPHPLEAHGAQAGEFQREDRYIVIKRKDLEKAPFGDRVDFQEALDVLVEHLPERKFLVIESDWPEYEPTWAAIQARVSGQGAQAGDGLPRSLRSVLGMVLNALDRDAADGKPARGEMAAELRAALATQPAVPEQYEYWCIAYGCWRPIQKLVEFLTARGFKVRAVRGAEHDQ